MFIIVREKLGAPVFLPLCALRFRHHNDVLHTSCTRVNNRTKDILKQPSRFNRKWVERERAGAPWKHRCCFFSQWKNQQVLLWTSFLSREETEDWDERKEKGREKAGGWKKGEKVRGRKKGKDANVKKQNTLVWVGACCPSLKPEMSLLPRVTTCYYYGLSDVSERRQALKDDKLSKRFLTAVKTRWQCLQVTPKDRTQILVEQPPPDCSCYMDVKNVIGKFRVIN